MTTKHDGIDPRTVKFRVVMETWTGDEPPKWSIYADYEGGPVWMGSFPSKSMAEKMRWAYRHARELLYALKHARAIIQEQMDIGMEFPESEIEYLDGTIDQAQIEKEEIT